MTLGKIFDRASSAGISTVILKFINQILSFLATVLLVRTLSEQEFGIYNILYGTIPLLGIVASIGLPSVLQRFLPEYYIKNEFILGAKLVGRASVIRFVVSVIILTGLILLWDSFAHLLKISDYKDIFMIFAICIIAFQQWGFLQISIEAHFLHKLSFGIQTVAMLLRGTAYFLCFINKLGILEIIVIDTVIYVTMMLAFWVAYRMRVPNGEGATRHFGRDETRRIVKFAAFSNFNSVGVQFMNSSTNYLVIAYFLTPAEVAIYAFCSQLASKIDRVNPVKYMASVVRPAFFTIGVDAKDDQTRSMIQFIVKCLAMFFIPIFCLFYLIGEDFIAVVFGKYSEYAYVFVGILGFTAVNAVGFPIGLAAQLRERVDIVLYSKIFGFCSLLASIVAIPVWGIMAAVVAVGVGGMLKNAFILWFVRDMFPVRQLAASIIRTAMYWAVLSAAMSFALTNGNHLQNLVIAAAAFLFGSASFLYFVGDWDEIEINFLEKLAEKSGLKVLAPFVARRRRAK